MYRCYTKIGLNLFSLFLSCIIFFTSECIEKDGIGVLKNISQQIQFFKQVSLHRPVQITLGENKEIEGNTKKVEKEKIEKVVSLQEMDWAISIPKINLLAPIQEGTSNSIMELAVGHFEETSKENGNVALAAHNRGYKQNFFQDIKKLKQGDKIVYKKGNFTKEYEVKETVIIRDIDWDYLQDTEDNRITLITCVENEPEYRRCIQAVEIIKKEDEKNEESN